MTTTQLMARANLRQPDSVSVRDAKLRK